MDRNMNQQSYDIEKLENIILESIIRFSDTRYLMSSIPYTHMQTSVNKLCQFSGPSSLGTEKNKPNTTLDISKNDLQAEPQRID